MPINRRVANNHKSNFQRSYDKRLIGNGSTKLIEILNKKSESKKTSLPLYRTELNKNEFFSYAISHNKCTSNFQSNIGNRKTSLCNYLYDSNKLINRSFSHPYDSFIMKTTHFRRLSKHLNRIQSKIGRAHV